MFSFLFNAGITTAGGSNTWEAATSFNNNGTVINGNNQSAFLNMGSYINATKGSATGKFIFSVTISEVNLVPWVGFGFFESNAPDIAANFTADAAKGMGIFIYRKINDTGSLAGELDGFAGSKTGGSVDGGAGHRHPVADDRARSDTDW